MTRSQLARKALGETIEKLRAEIEGLHEKGLAPADYSLGFANAMIFTKHRLEGHNTPPKLYDRKTDIGKLPMPVRFQHDAELLYAAVRKHIKMMEAREWPADVLESLKALEESLDAIDKYIMDAEAADEGKTPEMIAAEQKFFEQREKNAKIRE